MHLDRLERRFGPVTACAGMTWSAPLHAVTAILGPNGAGKTTAVDCAIGLQRPDGGSVTVLGAQPWGPGGAPRPGRRHAAKRWAAQWRQRRGLAPAPRPTVCRPARRPALMARLDITSFARTPVRRLSAGSASGSGSLPPCSVAPTCSSSTSRPPDWTPRPAGGLAAARRGSGRGDQRRGDNPLLRGGRAARRPPRHRPPGPPSPRVRRRGRRRPVTARRVLRAHGGVGAS